MFDVDLKKAFEYENGFYLTAGVDRMSKFATHLDLYRMASDVAGDIVECGVFKGVSLCRLIKIRSLFENAFSKKVIGFDTFGTFPLAGYEQDVKQREVFIREAGDQSISRERLLELLTALRLEQNVELVEGDILKTIPEYKKVNPQLKISLLHVDVDLYESTKVCLEEFYPLMTKGGVVVLDDYGAFAGANKAIDTYFKNKEVRIQKLPFSKAISYVVVP